MRRRTETGSIRIFGTGAGWPSADRNHSSHLYTFGNRSAIIDCGESLSTAFLNSGVSYDGFDHIFLSHTHGDHVGGFFMFMQGLWLKKRKRKLSIHMPAQEIEPVRRMLETCYVFPELFRFPHEWVPLEPGKPVPLGTASVTPWPTSHLDDLRRTFGSKYQRSFAAYCFLLEANGKRIGHSADIGKSEDLDALFDAPLDLLLCELAHCQPKDLFSYLANRPVREVIFTHVADRFRTPETVALAKRMLKGVRVRFARDGQRVSF